MKESVGISKIKEWVGSFKNRGVGVEAFVHRLHSPTAKSPISGPVCCGCEEFIDEFTVCKLISEELAV
jgi:hypothetical protein